MKQQSMSENSNAAMGFVTVALNALAVITSLQQEAEWALRCLSLLVGIGVGLLTLWNMCRNRRGRE